MHKFSSDYTYGQKKNILTVLVFSYKHFFFQNLKKTVFSMIINKKNNRHSRNNTFGDPGILSQLPAVRSSSSSRSGKRQVAGKWFE